MLLLSSRDRLMGDNHICFLSSSSPFKPLSRKFIIFRISPYRPSHPYFYSIFPLESGTVPFRSRARHNSTWVFPLNENWTPSQSQILMHSSHPDNPETDEEALLITNASRKRMSRATLHVMGYRPFPFVSEWPLNPASSRFLAVYC